MIHLTPQNGDALLIVDMQYDFLPGGTLPVPEGDVIIPMINRISHAGFDAVIACQDWHPITHCSFTSQGGSWPPHCIAGSPGAALHHALDQRPISHLIHKGMSPARECYSAFADENGETTGLTSLLQGLGITRLFLCGVALDYCVRASALDSQKSGFQTIVIPDLCRSIGPEDPVYDQFQKAGIPLHK